MSRDKFWEKLEEARRILNLSHEITRKELIEKYRSLVKKYHPDRGGDSEFLKRLNWAYEFLLNYCDNYFISLKPNLNINLPEEWWFYRFGDDPIWGKGEE